MAIGRKFIDKRVAVHIGNFASKALLDASTLIDTYSNMNASIYAFFATVGSDSGFKLYVYDSVEEEWRGQLTADIVEVSSDSASDPSATYDQAEVQAILDELRDLKTKMRSAGLLES